ncbi:MAG: ribonuclease HII [Candidatus Paceibacterota bacterium]
MKGTIGIDEVGRGPLAGPITVCACFIQDEKAVLKDIFGGIIRDSKKIKKDLRFNIYQTIKHKRYLKSKVEYHVSSRSSAYIDRHGISRATEACVLSCLQGLVKKGIDIHQISIKLDAGLKIKALNVEQKSFIKGDERFVEIALASIMAKEWRDSYMKRLSKIYPFYAWEENVGYGTKRHRESIRKEGATKYHRKTYLKAFKLFDKAE